MNKKLKNAKLNKKDEFYTQLYDIENELKHYLNHFKNKVIYCNCDNPFISDFFYYFVNNFKSLEVKKVICTCCKTNVNESAFYIEYKGDEFQNMNDYIKNNVKYLESDGDFRNDECIELLKQADIVVTNPPFSLFREYVAQLIQYDKKFIIVGHQNAITYKNIFSLIKDNKMWLGYGFKGSAGYFINTQYEDYASAKNHKEGMIRVSGVHWFTNLDIKKHFEYLSIHKTYNSENYPKYENFDAINVNRTSDIPFDYKGFIGVPITFLNKYNPLQFKILYLGIVGSINFTSNRKMEILDKNGSPTGRFTKNAKGSLYKIYDFNKDKIPSFKDCETGELYCSIYARIIIINLHTLPINTI